MGSGVRPSQLYLGTCGAISSASRGQHLAAFFNDLDQCASNDRLLNLELRDDRLSGASSSQARLAVATGCERDIGTR